MPFNVDQFRNALVLDGARPNLFECNITFPNGAGEKDQFFFKSAALPGSTIGVVNVPYFGREIKVAGNRTFADWTVTVINDEDFRIRKKFENWHRVINSHRENLRSGAYESVRQYGTDCTVTHYGKTGGKIGLGTYKFIGMFPSDIAQIDLDWGSNDTIEEFTVTLSYQYWTSADIQ